jgi:hypothetical protein
MTVHELVRDLRAKRESVATYSDRAKLLFEREDSARRRGNRQKAGNLHWAGVIAGHAAFAELNDPDVFR